MELRVTEHASTKLKEILEQRGDEPEEIVRLTHDRNGNLIHVFGQEKSGDHVIQHNGKPVLAIRPKLVKKLSGFTLDINEQGRFALYQTGY